MAIKNMHGGGAVIALSVLTLGACAGSETSPEPAPVYVASAAGQSQSAQADGDTEEMMFAYGDFVHYFETFEDMANVDVVIAKVVAERDGVVPPGGGDGHEFSELRRVITLQVTHSLTGDLPKSFEIQTLGWVVKDGRRTPLTFDGMPWLRVGDEAVMALDDPNHLGQLGFASEAAVQLFEGGRITAAPTGKGETAPPLSRAFEGMTKAEVVSAFASLGSSA